MKLQSSEMSGNGQATAGRSVFLSGWGLVGVLLLWLNVMAGCRGEHPPEHVAPEQVRPERTSPEQEQPENTPEQPVQPEHTAPEQVLRERTSPEPADPMVAGLMARAEWAMEKRSYTTALSVFSMIHSRAPSYVPAHHLRAEVLTRLHRYDEAELALERVLELQPDFEAIHFSLGNNAAQQGRYTEAIQHYREEMKDGAPGAGVEARRAVLVQIARSHRALGNVSAARTALEEAIELDPTYAEALDELGAIYEENGDLDEALDVRQQALEHDSDNAGYAYFLGALLVKLGRPDDAVPYLEQARAERPWFYGVYYSLGRSLIATGRLAKGEEYLIVADSLQKIDAELGDARTRANVRPTAENWRAYAEKLARAQRFEQALEAYHTARAIDPNDSASAIAMETIRQRLAPHAKPAQGAEQ